MARAYPAAKESKSRRTGICVVSFVIVMTPTLRAKTAHGKIHSDVRNMGQFGGPAPGALRDPGPGRAGGRAARRGPRRPPAPGHPAALVPGPGRRPGYRPQYGGRGL